MMLLPFDGNEFCYLIHHSLFLLIYFRIGGKKKNNLAIFICSENKVNIEGKENKFHFNIYDVLKNVLVRM